MIDGTPFVFGGGAQTSVDAVQSVSGAAPGTVVSHLPQARSDLATAKIGATVYLVGGYNGSTADREVLATTDGIHFRTVARLASGVRYPAVGALGDVLYVFGGEWANTPSDAVQAIDVRTGRVRVIGHLPEPRTQAAAFTIGGSIFVAGGNTPSGPSSAILRFDPSHASFVSAGSLPAPVADAAAVTVGNRVFLIGGEAPAAVAAVVVVSETSAPRGRGRGRGAATLRREAAHRRPWREPAHRRRREQARFVDVSGARSPGPAGWLLLPRRRVLRRPRSLDPVERGGQQHDRAHRVPVGLVAVELRASEDRRVRPRGS